MRTEENVHKNVQNDVLLNTSEVTKIFGFSYWTAQKLIRDGHIKAFKINGRWKIPLSSVKSFMSDSMGGFDE